MELETYPLLPRSNPGTTQTSPARMEQCWDTEKLNAIKRDGSADLADAECHVSLDVVCKGGEIPRRQEPPGSGSGSSDSGSGTTTALTALIVVGSAAALIGMAAATDAAFNGSKLRKAAVKQARKAIGEKITYKLVT